MAASSESAFFRTSNTSAEVLEAAMVLQRSGVSVAEIAGQTVGRMPLTTLRLWGRVLQLSLIHI